MKKIYLVLVLVITILMVNFAIWFWQTKIITNSINELKAQLALQNIKIDFSEIKFSTFKCWQVNGSIEKFSVFMGRNNNKPGVEIPTLNFYSRPFDKVITLESNDNILFYFNTLYSSKIYKVQYPSNNAAKINIELNVSFSDFLDMLYDQNRKPLYTAIHHLQWVNPEFTLIDEKNNFPYLSGKGILLDMRGSSTELSKDFEFNAIANDIQYHPNYDTNNLFEKLEQELNSKLGKINFIFQFHFKQQPDHEQLKQLQLDKNNKMPPVLNAYIVSLKNLMFSTSLFNLNITGTIEKQPEFIFPEGNLVLNITEYLTFLDLFVDTFNIRLEYILKEYPLLPSYKINDIQKEKIRLLLDSFKPVNNTLSLELSRHGMNGITVSGRPLFDVISSLTTLLNQPAPSNPSPTIPNPNQQQKNNTQVIPNNATLNKDAKIESTGN